MALVAHFNLELHQMDVKTAFLNDDLYEDMYMQQPGGQEHLVCKLKKSIYGLKQASRQWYIKFDEVMKKQGFLKNQVDQCTYLKMSGSNFTILVLYVDDILLTSNSIDMLHESKRILLHNFDMKDLGEAAYVIGIEIYRDRAKGILGLSQRAYLDTKYLFVRERVKENKLCVEYISTRNMLADPMTKCLPPKVFEEHVSKMGLSKDLI